MRRAVRRPVPATCGVESFRGIVTDAPTREEIDGGTPPSAAVVKQVGTKHRKRKWDKTARPDSLVVDVAHRAIADRLGAVLYYLPLAALRADEDVEYVHQLRVGTRRVNAAFNVFADVLPRRRTRRMAKVLKRVRRAAGAARDLDVLFERFTCMRDGGLVAAELPVAKIVPLRQDAQQQIIKTNKQLRHGKLRRSVRKLLIRIRKRRKSHHGRLDQMAPQALLPAAAAFFDAGRADLSVAENLHDMRIAGKQLRYAMELLAGAFDVSFRKELYPLFADVQERLGKINDLAVAEQRLRQWGDPPSAESDGKPFAEGWQAVLDAVQQEKVSHMDAFRAWWTTQRVNLLQQHFHQILNAAPASRDEATESMTLRS